MDHLVVPLVPSRGRAPRGAVATEACASCRGRRERAAARVLAFDDVVDSFCANGGLLDGDALAGTLRHRIAQPVSCIARLIVARRILSFAWSARTLVPLFQFRDATLVPRTEVADVIAELAGVLDDRELARWFASGNAWLGGASPVATMAADPDAVRAAARADRFVARGD